MPSVQTRNLAQELIQLEKKKMNNINKNNNNTNNSQTKEEEEVKVENTSCVSSESTESSITPICTGTRFDILMTNHNSTRPILSTSSPINNNNNNNNNNNFSLMNSKSKRRCVQQPFSHLLICDFEATCDAASVHYPHEIIEFPIVCIDTFTLNIVSEFHSFVRPVRNPKLTSFCTGLTGISQTQIDAAPTLPEVIKKFSHWLQNELYPLCKQWKETHSAGLSNCLRSQQKHFFYDNNNNNNNNNNIEYEKMICFVTDGPWDMRKFMFECSVLRDGYEFPPLFYRFINIRHSFCEYFHTRPRKLTDMLKKLGLTFHGQPHSGIDDARNIARIAIELLRRGYRVHHVSTIKYININNNNNNSNNSNKEERAAWRQQQELLLLEEFGEEELGRKHRKGGKKRGGKTGKAGK